jgi:hypothetical protein
MKIIGANITGSFILNNQDVTTTIQTSNVWSGSVATDITALNDATASLLNYTASQNSRNSTYATTGSNTFAGIQTVNSNLVVTGSITAATLVVQTITSSVDFVTGSTRFGSLAANTHVFTGSMSVTGSVTATSFAGSGAGLTSIPNAALTNSTISGISLGSNLATLTIGTGLSGTSYNGSTGVTIANSGVTSIVAGTNISISGGTGAVTITNGVTNNNQLTNGAGYITSAALSSYLPLGGGVTSGTITANFNNSWGFRLNRTANTNYIGIVYATGDTNNWYIGPREDGTNTYRIYNFQTTTNAFSVDINGNCTANGDVTAYSDKRIKENILPINNALDKVLTLNGVTYNRTDLEDKSTKIGFIAQEVEKVVPEIVLYDEKVDRYAVSYGNVTALLVEAVKEQQTQIEELKSIINGLTK